MMSNIDRIHYLGQCQTKTRTTKRTELRSLNTLVIVEFGGDIWWAISVREYIYIEG